MNSVSGELADRPVLAKEAGAGIGAAAARALAAARARVVLVAPRHALVVGIAAEIGAASAFALPCHAPGCRMVRRSRVRAPGLRDPAFRGLPGLA